MMNEAWQAQQSLIDRKGNAFLKSNAQHNIGASIFKNVTRSCCGWPAVIQKMCLSGLCLLNKYRQQIFGYVLPL